MICHPNPKINLGLNILGKRPDGYHDLETLFVPYFGMKDELEVVAADGGKGHLDISIEGTGVDWDPQKDLCAKAYRLLADEFGLGACRIRLVKNIPVGAGLGGGSSDAAFTLRMLRDIYSLNITDDRLAGYAAELGSDCAFFIWNRTMFGSGRGEILRPSDVKLDGFELKMEIPEGVSVSTREAYAGIVPHTPALALEEALKMKPEEWKNVIFNDFEKSVFALHPEIEELKKRMYDRGAVYAAMSGSGSAVFGLFEKGEGRL